MRPKLYAFKRGTSKWLYVTTVRGVMRKHETARYTADDVPAYAVHALSRNETAAMIRLARRMGYTTTVITL